MRNFLLLILLIAAPLAYFWWGVPFETVVIIMMSLIFILLIKLFQMELKQDEDLRKMNQEKSPPEIKDVLEEK